MTKGKFGLSLASIAVIAFGFGALRQPTAVLLVCGYALLAEKDTWLNKQAIQAVLLTITYYLAVLVSDWVFGGLSRLLEWVKWYGASGALSTVNGVMGDILYIAMIVFSVLAILRVLRGKDAGLPFLSKLAESDLAETFTGKPQKNPPPAYTAPIVQAPVQTQYVPPVQPSVPEAGPAAAGRVCPACSAPLQEDSLFCTECGAKIE